MVKYRNIELNLISQFDARKLPEYHFNPKNSPSSAPPKNDIASCYVPIYPGSQLWFEYCVDGPHPPIAAYLFKLLHNDDTVTSWDCTAKHLYRGKASYSLRVLGVDAYSGLPMVKREAFAFADGSGGHVGSGAVAEGLDDCIQVRVYRVEKRKRMPIAAEMEGGAGGVEAMRGRGRGFQYTTICTNIINVISLRNHRLVNGGLLDARCPRRRYQYQLLDPVDGPFATFRFYYRSPGFLKEKDIILSNCRCPSLPNSASGSLSHSGQSVELTSVPAIMSSAMTLSVVPKDSVEELRGSSPTRRSEGNEGECGGDGGQGVEEKEEAKKRPRPSSPFTSAGMLRFLGRKSGHVG